MIRKRRRLFAKWRQTQWLHHRLAYNSLRNKIQRYVKYRKNQYNQFVLSNLGPLSTSRPDFWKTVKNLLGERSYSNAPLIRGDTVHYDMTSKANILTNILPPFPQHLTPYCLKYFLDFIGVLIHAFLPSQSNSLMFTMCYYLLKPFNDRKSQKIGAYVFGYNSPPAAAREVFKPSTDSASLVVPSQKKFQFWVWGSLGGSHKWGCFRFFMAYFTRPWTPIEWAHVLAQIFLWN